MKPVILGTIASVGLLLVYVVTMTLLTGSWAATIEQFTVLWWLMVPISVGFGTQVGLYVKLSDTMKQHARDTLAAGGSSAVIGMLTCCVHHIADILPLVGLSAISIFLIRFQIPILVTSLAINGIGIYFMLKHLQTVTQRRNV